MTDLSPRELSELAGPLSPDAAAAAWLLGYSGRTREAYQADLREWATFLNADPFTARRLHVEGFARWLEQKGQAKSTVARKLSSLSSFYRYVESEGLMDRNPVANVRRPRLDQSPSTGLTLSELRAFLSASKATGRREHALCLLLALNGLRIGESLSLDVADMGHERGHTTLSLTRKGDKRQTVPLATRTAEAITTMLDGRDQGPLFLNLAGNRLDRHTAWKLVARISKGALGYPIGPHALRHTWVSQALDAGAQLRDVQVGAGHSDPKTTASYDSAIRSLDRNPTFLVAARLA